MKTMDVTKRESNRSREELSMKIQINETQLSAHAKREQADLLIEALKEKGWPVEYTPGPAVWEFGSIHQLYEFEGAFDTLNEELFPPVSYRVRFPCDCDAELHSDFCECGIIDDPVVNVAYRDFERALEEEAKAVAVAQ